MTTFQAIVYGIVRGFTDFLPVGSNAHMELLPYFFGWSEAGPALKTALSLGSLGAVLLYFIHDWASMLSSFLQVVLLRKRPLSLDERLPFFLFLSAIPVALARFYFAPQIAELNLSPLILAASLAFFGIPLAMSENFSRKNKNMFDWNWLDALIVGIAQVAALVPGCGRMTAALPGALYRNYTREAAAKYTFFLSVPFLAGSVWIHFHEVRQMGGLASSDLTKLSFFTTFLVTLLCGLLAIGGFLKQIHRGNMRNYVIYRWVIALGVVLVFWLRSQDYLP